MSVHPFHSVYPVQHHKEAGCRWANTQKQHFTPTAKLETPVNLTPLIACLWTVVRSWSTQGEPRQSPDRKAAVLMVDSNCEVTVLTTAPPCRHVLRYIKAVKRDYKKVRQKQEVELHYQPLTSYFIIY